VRPARKLVTTLSQAYASAPFRDAVIEMVAASLDGESRLADAAIRSVQAVHEYLHRDFRYIKSSLTQAITRRLGYRSYINAAAGRSLYARTEFEKGGVELSFIRSEIESYPQGGRHFVGGPSIIDLLMWNSPESAGEILSQYKIEQS